MDEQKVSKELKAKGKFNSLLGGVLILIAGGLVAATLPLWLPYTIGIVEYAMTGTICAGAGITLGFGIAKLASGIKNYLLGKNIEKLDKQTFVKKYEKSKNAIAQKIVEKYKEEITSEVEHQAQETQQDDQSSNAQVQEQTISQPAPSQPKNPPRRPVQKPNAELLPKKAKTPPRPGKKPKEEEQSQ